MFQDKYIGAYTEVQEEGRDSLPVSLKKRMKGELFEATAQKQYTVQGNGYTGAVVIVEVTEPDVPNDIESFKQEIDADEVVVRSSVKIANRTLR